MDNNFYPIEVLPVSMMSIPDRDSSSDTPSGGQVIGVGVAVGGGVGASLALTQGGLVGTALVTVWGAGIGGLIAAGYAGWQVGSWLSERDIIKENLQKGIEKIFPIDMPDRPKIEIKAPESKGEKFSVDFNSGQESYDFKFYVDAMGDEGISFDDGWHDGVEYFSDAWAAGQAAEKAGLYWPEYEETAVIGKAGNNQLDVMLC